MLINLGSAAFAFSIVTSVLAIFSAIYGNVKKNRFFFDVARQAVNLHLLVLSIVLVCLLILLSIPDLSVKYVMEHVNHALPLFYKITSLWAGQAGSLFFWNFLLVFFSAIAIHNAHKKDPHLTHWIIIILMTISLFFCLLGNFSSDSDPFIYATNNNLAWSPQDGRGLNPLLQHWAMIIHPPILYFGYVSFAIPFAIAMAALATGRINLQWTKLIRRWSLFSWFFLGTGLLLGGKWAYEELGWGGYWAWDPVENASLLPWLTGTAFLHSIIVQEKRDMLKVWNMFLISLSFLMCIFGTFLTRSGIVSSVHAFASSKLGPFFVIFLVAIILFSGFLIIYRLPLLKSDKPINSFLSRETGFLANNILLLIALVVVLWGTLYPAITEAITKEKISVTSVWFNKWMTPIGITVLFLTGCGPLLAWRSTSAEKIRKNFFIPLLVFFLVNIIYFSIRIILIKSDGLEISAENLKIYAGLTFATSSFVITGVIEEFIRSTIARIQFTRENFFIGFLLLLFQNKRRYLGYMAHIGLAILFIGFAGQAFTKETKLTLGKGESEYFGGFLVKVSNYENLQYGRDDKSILYTTEKITFEVYKDNLLLGTDTTERRNYPMFSFQTGQYSDKQETSEPGIVSKLFYDVYLQYGGVEKGRLVLQMWVNPLVSIVWFGFAFLTLASLILLLPIGEGRTFRIGRKLYSVSPMAPIPTTVS